MQRVLIVGAGFSRAISEMMPLTDELGQRAASSAGLDDARWGGRGRSFEFWLSRLAEDQPDLNMAENLANRSLSVRLADEVAATLVDIERGVLNGAAPSWFLRLIGLLHATRTVVISFNYD